MENTASSLPFFFLFMLILSFNTGGFVKLVNGDQKTWCVAKPSTEDSALQNNIDYVRIQGIDCSSYFERDGCPCFKPNTLINHASVAMNLYYQKNGRNHWNCNFTSSGLITTIDPRIHTNRVLLVRAVSSTSSPTIFCNSLRNSRLSTSTISTLIVIIWLRASSRNTTALEAEAESETVHHNQIDKLLLIVAGSSDVATASGLIQ
ncbi:Glucan endo-1,3-beta-D-glucosidase [Thalictrum thalictroides]|uniref:Glucan endo-1,3-beta-D-glucosidase n=1 Tax=Thalictrum thalictroides TaxID=46969 RepID=A0A7J6WWY8_THATH|nr:Glucan endo-1,3-beta-D-glucosidase [Thalictrum thalictroides]